MADTGKSQIVKRPSLSFEFHDSPHVSGPFQFDVRNRTQVPENLSCAGYIWRLLATPFSDQCEPDTPIFPVFCLPGERFRTPANIYGIVGPLGLEPRTKGFTSAPPFPEGVDYLFTHVGCGTL
jgi:hypothetical protein